jgi:HD-GYP domain-containing protein (c-di-GMP phosphodiesterase class II)
VDVLETWIGEFGLEELPNSAVMRHLVAGHHDCLDGSGYSLGLKGDAIPMEARIIAVADVLGALTSHRPYKQPWCFDDAIAELERLVAIGKFDGDGVAAVKRRREEIIRIRDRFSDM